MHFNILFNLQLHHNLFTCTPLSISTLSPLLSKKIIHKRFKPWVSCLVVYVLCCTVSIVCANIDKKIVIVLYGHLFINSHSELQSSVCCHNTPFVLKHGTIDFYFVYHHHQHYIKNLHSVLVETETFESFRNNKLRYM